MELQTFESEIHLYEYIVRCTSIERILKIMLTEL